MKIIIRIILFAIVIASPSSVAYAAEKMTQKRMESIVKGIATKSEGEKGRVSFYYQEVLIYLISDPVHNRMRLIAPIAKYADLERQHVDAAMISNFHLALDARYAVTKGVLYSAYLHPLKELTEAQIESAVKQVASLALTFGTQYSSGELTFGGKRKEKQIH